MNHNESDLDLEMMTKDLAKNLHNISNKSSEQTLNNFNNFNHSSVRKQTVNQPSVAFCPFQLWIAHQIHSYN